MSVKIEFLCLVRMSLDQCRTKPTEHIDSPKRHFSHFVMHSYSFAHFSFLFGQFSLKSRISIPLIFHLIAEYNSPLIRFVTSHAVAMYSLFRICRTARITASSIW